MTETMYCEVVQTHEVCLVGGWAKDCYPVKYCEQALRTLYWKASSFYAVYVQMILQWLFYLYSSPSSLSASAPIISPALVMGSALPQS